MIGLEGLARNLAEHLCGPHSNSFLLLYKPSHLWDFGDNLY